MVGASSRVTYRREGVSRRTFVKAVGASGVTAGLAGCTGRGQSDPNVITWAADADAADASEDLNNALHEAGLSKDIRVDIQAGSSNTDVRQAQYQRWLSANLEEPDLVMTDSGWTIPFIEREQLMNLSENLPQEMVQTVENDYFQASVETAKSEEGDLYSIPLYPDFPTMQYRKDLVEDAGYDPEGENWAQESISWKKFSEVTRKVVDENDDIAHGFTFQADIYEGLACCDFNEFMTSWGGAFFGDHSNLFGPIGERPVTVGEDPVVQSTRMIRTFIHGSDAPETLDGYQGNISPTGVLQWDEDTSLAPFSNGNAVMHRNWPYAIVENGAEEAFGENLGVMPIPYGVPENEAEYEGTGGPTAALGGWHISINPNTPKLENTIEVLRAMMQPSFKLKVFEVLGWLPPEPQLLQSDQARNVPIIGRYVDQLRTAGENAVPRPVTAVWPQQSGKVSQSVHNAYSGAQPPEQAMTTLNNQLREIEDYNADQ